MLAPTEERIVVDARRHGVVLVRPFARAATVAAAGAAAVVAGWPFSAAGAGLLVVAAAGATATVWRWHRTHVVLTTEKLVVVHGLVRRRAAAVHLARIGPLELEQTLLGRLLGYGTLVAGGLEIQFVPDARRIAGLADQLAGDWGMRGGLVA